MSRKQMEAEVLHTPRTAANKAATGLSGARVALLEARMTSTMTNLVEMYGGQPYAVPALRETPVASERVDRLVHGIARGRFSIVIFQTGVAAQLLFDESEKRGMLAEVRERLARCTTVCRGPKPAAALYRNGVKATAAVEEPFTTEALVRTLAALDVSRKSVALLHYGERNRELSLTLRRSGARLAEFLLYEWQLPADTSGLQTLVGEIIAGTVDAIAFTNQIQVRHLYQVADTLGQAEELADSLTRSIIVASIGPSCTHQLQLLGIHPRVTPAIPKMRPLIAALSEYFRYARSA
jgi:uroporphyrinogen-III synthase